MGKATDELLKDHKMVRKVLDEIKGNKDRLEHLQKTLHRVILGHAWFEDNVFLPAVEKEPLLSKIFLDELYQEHKDIDRLLALIRKTPTNQTKELEYWGLQFKTVLDTHFKKEEDALFPLCEKILDSEGQNRISAEMHRRQTEIRNLLSD